LDHWERGPQDGEQRQGIHRDETGLGVPSWYVDSLGAVGLPLHNVVTMIDKLRMELYRNGFICRGGPPAGFYP
jgi:hypothetical protein